MRKRLIGYAFEAHDTLQYRFLEKVDQRVECKRMTYDPCSIRAHPWLKNYHKEESFDPGRAYPSVDSALFFQDATRPLCINSPGFQRGLVRLCKEAEAVTTNWKTSWRSSTTLTLDTSYACRGKANRASQRSP